MVVCLKKQNKRHGGEWVECYIGNLDIDGAGLLTRPDSQIDWAVSVPATTRNES